MNRSSRPAKGKNHFLHQVHQIDGLWMDGEDALV